MVQKDEIEHHIKTLEAFIKYMENHHGDSQRIQNLKKEKKEYEELLRVVEEI